MIVVSCTAKLTCDSSPCVAQPEHIRDSAQVIMIEDIQSDIAISQVILMAIRYGWVIANGRHICPDCALRQVRHEC